MYVRVACGCHATIPVPFILKLFLLCWYHQSTPQGPWPDWRLWNTGRGRLRSYSSSPGQSPFTFSREHSRELGSKWPPQGTSCFKRNILFPKEPHLRKPCTVTCVVSTGNQMLGLQFSSWGGVLPMAIQRYRNLSRKGYANHFLKLASHCSLQPHPTSLLGPEG